MPSHAGQVAFFGGHRQDGEENPWIVAQREFEEETSLSRSVVEFLGYLPVVIIGKYQSIVPVVGELKISTEEFLSSAKSNGEWDEVFVYSWKELSIEENWEFAWKYTPNRSPIFFHTIRAANYLSQRSNEDSHILWGATASMIWSLLQRYFYNYSENG